MEGLIELTKSHPAPHVILCMCTMRAFRSMHASMIRQMLGMRRPPDVDLSEYMVITARKVRKAVEATGFLWWDDYLPKQIYFWAGHVGRMSVYDGSRIVLQTIQHKLARKDVPTPRNEAETWIEYIRRATPCRASVPSARVY